MKGNEYKITGDTAECILHDGSVAIVSVESIPLLRKYTWCKSGNGYAVTGSRSTGISMQRLLTGAKRGEIVDHADLNPLNNTLGNLRVCSRQENSANTGVRRDSTTGIKGVSWHYHSKKYRAYITVFGKQKHLGLFDTAEEAQRVYSNAAKYYFADFARCV